MSYKDDISDRLKMDVNNWPHQFTRQSRGVEMGKSEFGVLLFAIPMICIHCHIEYIQNKTPRPPDPCPARNKKREIKRILG